MALALISSDSAAVTEQSTFPYLGPPPQKLVILVSCVFAVTLIVLASQNGQAAASIALLGIAAGVTLNHASFGFATAYRQLLEMRDVRPAQAQCVMLGVSTVLFAPLLGFGHHLGLNVTGAVAPAGISVAIGAFAFGIGMQMAGACASGSLYAAGTGQGRMAVVLATFCAGSFLASTHMEFWERLPAFSPMSLGQLLSWPIAIALQTMVLGAIYLWLNRQSRIIADDLDLPPETIDVNFLRGPWSLRQGAIALALINVCILLVAGQPWSTTWAFTLWGAKLAYAAGWFPGDGLYWGDSENLAALNAGLMTDTTSIMNIGIVIGSLFAAGASGGYRPRFDTSRPALLSAILGGLAMGYGARIAFGCNVGAFFSGVASTSLHGWLWIASALPGCWVGLKLRARYFIA